MRILALTSKNSGVGYHRIMMPVVHMEKDYAFITDTISEEVLEKGYDILLINRFLSNISLNQILEWRSKYKFKLVVDNDDYWSLEPSHQLYERYKVNNITEHIINYLREADLCTCTHSRLAEEIYQYNKNVVILPNALPYGMEQFNDEKIESKLVRLFWSGSGTHQHDIAILKNPLKRCSNLPIRSIIAGYNEQEKPIWDTMISTFTLGLKLNPILYKYSDVINYMNAYKDSDIGLVPLVDNKFNSMKSNLKVLEIASKKNPAIVSYVNPYLDLPVHYVKKQSDWYKHIKDLSLDKAMREESGNNLFEHCRKVFNFNDINKQRALSYKNII
jgi:hypothetical protein